MMRESTDGKLLHRHAGDAWPEAFGELAERYGRLVYGAAYRSCETCTRQRT